MPVLGPAAFYRMSSQKLRKPEQLLLLLLHSLSHSGCKRLEPEVLEQAKKKSGVPESILLEPTRLELIEKVE